MAERVGVTTRTIRYYEELGLLERPRPRTKGAHRLYTEADIARLEELIRLRDLLGLTLEELVALAEARGGPGGPAQTSGPRAQATPSAQGSSRPRFRSSRRQLEPRPRARRIGSPTSPGSCPAAARLKKRRPSSGRKA